MIEAEETFDEVVLQVEAFIKHLRGQCFSEKTKLRALRGFLLSCGGGDELLKEIERLEQDV